LLPSFLPHAFSGIFTPIYAGRESLSADEILAFRATNLHLIRKNLHPVSAIRAFKYLGFDIPVILTGAFINHFIFSPFILMITSLNGMFLPD
jgi:hypothetical protein